MKTFYEFLTEKLDPRVPVTIRNHEGVAEAELGASSNVDYKYDVFLKDGWVFSSGRMAGCQTGHFNSVNEFRQAGPKKK